MPRNVCKTVVVGESQIGKSSLVNRYSYGRFLETYKPTIGADFFYKTENVQGDEVTVQAWDTPGREAYQSLGTMFYRGSDSFIFAAAWNNLESLASLKAHAKTCIEAAGGDTGRVRGLLVLTKSDAANKVVTNSDARAIMSELEALGVDFIHPEPLSTSAKDGSGIAAVFTMIADDFVTQSNKPEVDMPCPVSFNKNHSDDDDDEVPKKKKNSSKTRKTTGRNFFGFKN